jgi:RecA-family ATPase
MSEINQSAVRKFPTFTLRDLENLPTPSWLIDGVLPEDSFITLFGPPGATKSFWALDAALSIASGADFHGRPVEQGTVLYLVGEGLRGVAWRIQAWLAAHPEHDPEVLQKHFVIIPTTVRLLEGHEREMLRNTTEDIDNLKLVVVDTWARALTGGDENSAGDAGTAIEALENIRRVHGNSSLVIHHTGNEGSRERGSTALRGASDTSMRMFHDPSNNLSKLECMKMKDGTKFPILQYRLEPKTESVVLREFNNPTDQRNNIRSTGAPVGVQASPF